jgi:hypothetical protein
MAGFAVEMIRASDKRERDAFASGVIVNRDDVIRIVAGNGGYAMPRSETRSRCATTFEAAI